MIKIEKIKKTVPVGLILISIISLFSCTSGDPVSNLEYDKCGDGELEVWGFTVPSGKDHNKALSTDACINFIRHCIAHEAGRRSNTLSSEALTFRIYEDHPEICRFGEPENPGEKNIETTEHKGGLFAKFKYSVAADDLEKIIERAIDEHSLPRILLVTREEMNLAGKGKKIYSTDSKHNKSKDWIAYHLNRNGLLVLDFKVPGSIRAPEVTIIRNPEKFLVNEDLWSSPHRYDMGMTVQVSTNPDSKLYSRESELRIYRANARINMLALFGKNFSMETIASDALGEGYSEQEAARNAINKLFHGDVDGNPGDLLYEVTEELKDLWKQRMSENRISLTIRGIRESEKDAFIDFLEEWADVNDAEFVADSTGVESPETLEVEFAGTAVDLNRVLLQLQDRMIREGILDNEQKLVSEKVRAGNLELAIVDS